MPVLPGDDYCTFLDDRIQDLSLRLSSKDTSSNFYLIDQGGDRIACY